MIDNVDPLVGMVHNPGETLPDNEEDKVLVEPHESFDLKNKGTIDAAFQPENDLGKLSGVALRFHELWISLKTLLEHTYSVTAWICLVNPAVWKDVQGYMVYAHQQNPRM